MSFQQFAIFVFFRFGLVNRNGPPLPLDQVALPLSMNRRRRMTKEHQQSPPVLYIMVEIYGDTQPTFRAVRDECMQALQFGRV